MNTTAMRRSARPSRRGMALPLGVAAVAVALLLLWPGFIEDKLMALAAGVCPQRPDHSYWLGGAVLPLEARMFGIFTGMSAVIALTALRRGRGLALPTARLFGLMLLPIALMAADGLNATTHDLGLGALYLPDNALRLATGLAGGAAIAVLFLPVAAHRVTTIDHDILRLADYAILAIALASVWLANVEGFSWTYYPLAFIAVAGLMLTLALLNLLLLIAVAGGRVTTRSASLVALGLALATVELLALGQLRHALLDGLHIH